MQAVVRSVLWVVVIGVPIAAWHRLDLSGAIEEIGRRRFAESLGVLGAVVLVIVAAHLLSGRSLDANKPWLIPLVIAVAVVALGLALGRQERERGFVAYYCMYGAVSQQQLDGCLDHVTDDEVLRRSSNAARFAGAVVGDCLRDAGPFCEMARARQFYDAVHSETAP